MIINHNIDDRWQGPNSIEICEMPDFLTNDQWTQEAVDYFDETMPGWRRLLDLNTQQTIERLEEQRAERND